tara:strand:- start:4509 stop:5627 length:1119 start_codon:yes stop_codon:yes gene_type:complete
MYSEHIKVFEKLKNLNYFLIIMISSLSFLGFALLYSAGGGSFLPWAQPQIIRFFIGFVLMIFVAIVNLRVILNYAYAFYGLSFILLVAVEVFGMVGMGAQRWIDIGFLRIQPSELMKIGLVLALACYYHRLGTEEVRHFKFMLVPLALIVAPSILVLKQPDLGTTLLLVMIGVSIIFAAGAKARYFVIAGLTFLGSIPFAWNFLHDYQKNRVMTFLNPEQDPLGAGYHILQSKIALGSGGLTGKGFLKGTQSHLNFLPEKQTDFIFTMFCEEFGLIGALALITVYMTLIFYCLVIAIRCRNRFGQLLVFGITMTLFIYVFINIAMVIGLVPVVGVPLPLVSYGGTSLITLLLGFGLLLNADVHQEFKLPRYD